MRKGQDKKKKKKRGGGEEEIAPKEITETKDVNVDGLDQFVEAGATNEKTLFEAIECDDDPFVQSFHRTMRTIWTEVINK